MTKYSCWLQICQPFITDFKEKKVLKSYRNLLCIHTYTNYFEIWEPSTLPTDWSPLLGRGLPRAQIVPYGCRFCGIQRRWIRITNTNCSCLSMYYSHPCWSTAKNVWCSFSTSRVNVILPNIYNQFINHIMLLSAEELYQSDEQFMSSLAQKNYTNSIGSSWFLNVERNLLKG